MPNLQLRPLLRQLTIQTKDLTIERLNIDSPFGWAQREFVDEIERQYNAGRPVRIIVLKARQLGISTATEGVLFNWAFLHPGTHGLVIAHDNDSTGSIFDKAKFYWERWPFNSQYTLKYATRRELVWLETKSHLKVATAKNVGSGRGSTIHAVHLSECSRYDNPVELMTGLYQTIPNVHGTMVVMESTANGVGNWFHKTWQRATQGESEYVPLFFPWFKHYEYQAYTSLCVKSELSTDERELLRLGSSYENLQWRRWALPNLADNDIDFFMQEYPATPEEAFISTGHPIFPYVRLRECFQRSRGARGNLFDLSDRGVEFIPDSSGYLTIYKKPRLGDDRQDRYFVAADPSRTIEGDPACIQVINRKTYEQVAVWHGHINPMGLADEMIKLGKYYNNATLCPEIEGGGQGTIATLLARNYPNIWMHRPADRVPRSFNAYGWSTSYQRKRWMVGTLLKLIIDRGLIIHDQITFDQLQNYTVLPNGEYGNSDPDVHDDGVTAFAICVTASQSQGPFLDYEDTHRNSFNDIIDQEYENYDGLAG